MIVRRVVHGVRQAMSDMAAYSGAHPHFKDAARQFLATYEAGLRDLTE
jgi:hypothetical protein